MKINFRTIIILIFVVLYLVLSMPLHLVIWLIGRKKPMTKFRIAHKIIRWAFGCVFAIGGIKPHVYGVENIPKDEPVVFVANHRSYMDILLHQIKAGVPVGFVGKEELKKIPLLGFWMADIGCVFLDRSSAKNAIKSFQTGVEYLKAGCSMTICPEGTRSHDLDVKDFKDGSLKLATKAKVRVVPFAVVGTDDCFENNPGTKITKGDVYIAYGEPLDVLNLPDEDKKHLGAYTHKKVCELFDGIVAIREEDRKKK